MDSNLDKIAKDLYGKIQTRFRDITMGDENANVLSKKEDIPKARFFEFEYTEGGVALGTIAITLDAQDGIVIQVSGDLVDDDNNLSGQGAYKFIRGFRQFAKDRLLNFDVQNIGKSNLDKRDYKFQAKRKEEPAMPAIMENKLYGNARMSYQDLGEARLVIKHSQPVNTDLPAGRTLHIESIYIENAQGERFRYPRIHLNGARALAEHIKHGGTPYDAIGKHITGLSEELASLRKFKGYVSRQEQLSEAMASVTNRVMERIEEVKKEINNLQRSAYYETFAESFVEAGEIVIPEELQNDLIDRLTVRTFNEELKAVFPYIYKFIDESELPIVELGVDDILGEQVQGGQDLGDGFVLTTINAYGTDRKAVLDTQTNTYIFPNRNDSGGAIARTPAAYLTIKDGQTGGIMNLGPATAAAMAKAGLAKPVQQQTPEDQFESFLDDIIREDKDELFSPNPQAQSAAITKLNQVIAQDLDVGPNGNNGLLSVKGIIDKPDFVELVKQSPAEMKLNDLIKGYLSTGYDDLVSKLDFEGTDQAANATQPEPATTEPAVTAPTAEPTPTEPAIAAEPAPTEEPAPVAEGLRDPKDNPCWKGYKPVGTKKKGGRTVPNCVPKNEGIANLIMTAKDAGATLETQLDFGSKVMSLGEIIEGCGMSPQDFGFGQKMVDGEGIPAMMKYIAGFYNKEQGNFPLGGMRVKIKVKKAAEDGEFGNVTPEEVAKIIQFIDAKDPSGNEHNQIMRLAGVKKETQPEPGFDVSTLEDQLNSMSLQFNEADQQFPALRIGDIDPKNGKKILSAMTSSDGTVVRSRFGDIFNVKYGEPTPAPVPAPAPAQTRSVNTDASAANSQTIAQRPGAVDPALQPAPVADAPNPPASVNAQGQNVTIQNPDGSSTNPESGVVTPAPRDASTVPDAARGVQTVPSGPKNRDSMTFGQAFADARKSGEQTFTWKGKKYGTQMAKPKVKQSGKPAPEPTPAPGAVDISQPEYGTGHTFGLSSESVGYNEDQALASIVQLAGLR